MSSSVGRVYDDYDCYEWLCEKVGAEPKGIRSGFMEHFRELKDKHGYKRTYDGIRKVSEEE